MYSSGYVIRFILVITSVVALVLATMFSILKEKHDENEAIFNRKAILKAVQGYLPGPVGQMSDTEVQSFFEKNFDQLVLNMEGEEIEGITAEEIKMDKEKKKPLDTRRLPLYVFESSKGKVYILSVRGKGLWDEIWGNIAVQDDLNTIVGTAFDHKAETPGLGAEIKDNPAFPKQFENKKLYNEKGEYVSVTVRKGGARDPIHEVDGITGATITSNGVTEMLFDGIKYYQPFFDKIKNKSPEKQEMGMK